MLIRIHKTFDTEADKLGVLDVGVSVEVFSLCTLAH